MWNHSFLVALIIAAISMSCSKEDMPDNVPIYYMAIASGGFHSLALEPDGTLWTWGSNTYGQLGDGTTMAKNRPVRIGSDYVAISAGAAYSLALKKDSTLWAWGSNSYGELGDGTFINKSTPVLIGSDFTRIATGGMGPFGFSSHSLALKSDGTLWAWGSNIVGQLGDGTGVDKSVPVLIGTGYAAIDAGSAFSIALKKNGSLWHWGWHGNGTDYLTPVQIGLGYSAIAAGLEHFLVIKSDSTAWAWGLNNRGQLGDGSNLDKYNLVPIDFGYAAVSAGGIGFFNSFYGGYPDCHSLALTINGTLKAWGANFYGQLGDGSNGDRNTPVQIGSGYAAISAGGKHSLALKTDGTLWAWGDNYAGQLGDGTNEKKNTPVQIGPH